MSNREIPQTDEAVWVLSQDDWVPVQSHLFHGRADVHAGVAFAKRQIGNHIDFVVLQQEREKSIYYVTKNKDH